MSESVGNRRFVGDVTFVGNLVGEAPQTWNLVDSDPTALSFDSTGLAGILNIDTSTGAERVTMAGALDVTGLISAATMSLSSLNLTGTGKINWNQRVDITTPSPVGPSDNAIVSFKRQGGPGDDLPCDLILGLDTDVTVPRLTPASPGVGLSGLTLQSADATSNFDRLTFDSSLGTLSLSAVSSTWAGGMFGVEYLKANGGVILVGDALLWEGNSLIWGGDTDGQIVLANNAWDNFDRLIFGGNADNTTPAWKKSLATFHARLGDDSAFTTVSAATPTLADHLTTKLYVDSLINGLDWQNSVLDQDLATPPGSPSTGDRYIVAATATGAWVGQEEKIAQWNGSSWDFITPNKGYATLVEDENTQYTYNDVHPTGTWVFLSTAIGAHAASHVGAGADPITSLGAVSFTGDITMGATNALRWGATASEPMLKRSGTTVSVRLGNDTGDANLTCNDLFAASGILGVGLSVGHGGTPSPDLVTVGDGNFGLSWAASGTVPTLIFDGSGNSLQYTRATNVFDFLIGGQDSASVTGSGLSVPAGRGVAIGGAAIALNKLRVQTSGSSLDPLELSTTDSTSVLISYANTTRTWKAGPDASDNFIIRDFTGGLTPVTIEAGADADLLYLTAAGNLGIRTTTTSIGPFPVRLKSANDNNAPFGGEVTTAIPGGPGIGMWLKHTTSAEATDGFGASLVFAHEDATSGHLTGSRINSIRSGADDAIGLQFQTRNGGSTVDAMTIAPAGDIRAVGDVEIDGALNHDGTTAGFYGTAPVTKPTVTGSRGGNAALASLLTALAGQGLLTDSTTA